MATITATTATSAITRPMTSKPSMALGFPQLRVNGARVKCLYETKGTSNVAAGIGASIVAVSSVLSSSSPVLALVDERMSTEGTGLSLGISNNLLVWILAGVFGLIWALYFVYTSTLDEDEDSGLSL